MRVLVSCGAWGGRDAANTRSTAWQRPLRSRLFQFLFFTFLSRERMNRAAAGDLGSLDLLEELEDRL